MFTGIIEATGSVSAMRRSGTDWRLTIASEQLDYGDVAMGDSIAVNGCCLTVVELGSRTFSADVSNETMSCTTLGKLETGARVNLEKAMLATDRFGGHIVSGHVDGVGQLVELTPDGNSLRLRFAMPATLARYVAAKGSICVDGTSLTVNAVAENTFTVNVIPHTQQETVIGDYRVGCQVNLEMDIIARYLERLLQAGQVESAGAAGISDELLARHGFK